MPAALTERCQKGMVLSCLHPVLPPASWIPAQNRPEESTGSLRCLRLRAVCAAARGCEARGGAWGCFGLLLTALLAHGTLLCCPGLIRVTKPAKKHLLLQGRAVGPWQGGGGARGAAEQSDRRRGARRGPDELENGLVLLPHFSRGWSFSSAPCWWRGWGQSIWHTAGSPGELVMSHWEAASARAGTNFRCAQGPSRGCQAVICGLLLLPL